MAVRFTYLIMHWKGKLALAGLCFLVAAAIIVTGIFVYMISNRKAEAAAMGWSALALTGASIIGLFLLKRYLQPGAKHAEVKDPVTPHALSEEDEEEGEYAGGLDIGQHELDIRPDEHFTLEDEGRGKAENLPAWKRIAAGFKRRK